MTAMQHLFLSPHFDDAVWSCGGRIANLTRRGDTVVVGTVFSGMADEPIQDGWRQIANNKCRIVENRNALRRLNAKSVDLGYLEAALRKGRDREYEHPNPTTLFDAKTIPPDGMIPLLAESLAVLFDGAWDSINVPLSTGGHVDHVLVRKAAERCTGTPLTYYEDFPYQFSPAVTAELRPHHYPLSEEDVNTWLGSARSYRSQIIWLFGTSRIFSETLVQRALEPTDHGVRYRERFWAVDN
jgi:LmbE family N-acetylglucosaminyl deacetylase